MPTLPLKKKDPWAIPPIANPLDVTFGDAVSEGATAYAQDYGAEPGFASKLGEMFSGALNLYPPVAAAGAIHDASTRDDPQSMWNLTSTAMSAVNPFNSVQKVLNAADPGFQPGPAKAPAPLAMSATPQEPVKLEVSPLAETLGAATTNATQLPLPLDAPAPQFDPKSAVDFTRMEFQPETGYLYHATNSQNAQDIASAGHVGMYPPDHGTDQMAWPDGSVENRSYWTQGNPSMFVPEGGAPVLLRTKQTDAFQPERGTSDWVTNQPVNAPEYLTTEGWRTLGADVKPFDPYSDFDLGDTLAGAVEQPRVTGLGHASPHLFDKFEWSPKTRSTGEGAQAFGDGLYFAENPRVLDEHYIPKFTKMKMQLDSPEGPIHPAVSDHRPSKLLGDTLEDSNGDFDLAIQSLKDSADWYRRREGHTATASMYIKDYEDAVAMAETWRKNEGGFRMDRTPANVYEVELMADPNKFLDFDAPLSEQMHVWEKLSPEVREAIDDAINNRGDWNGFGDALDSYTGRDLYNMLKHEDVHEVLPTEVGNSSWETGDTTPARHTSQYLHSLGVPGIKFKDAYSRNSDKPGLLLDGKPLKDNGSAAHAGYTLRDLKTPDAALSALEAERAVASDPERQTFLDEAIDTIRSGRLKLAEPTRNWVVFSDDIVKIVKKNGVAAALAAGVISQTEADELYAQGYT